MKSLLVFALSSPVMAAPAPVGHHQEPQQQLQHANHIFNAIHSSMRQWGSSLNHNGMSVFVADVPEETEFYHGSSSPYRVNGTEWLAFEPEHALMFARGPRGPPPGEGERPQGGPPDNEHEDGPSPPLAEPSQGQDAWQGMQAERKIDLRRHKQPETRSPTFDQLVKQACGVAVEQNPILSDDAEERHGYLHTYRTKHPLRLLYIDGQSAAKSDKGTLDLQDMVLLHREPPNDVASHSMRRESKRSIDVELDEAQPRRKPHNEPPQERGGRRHHPIEGNSRNREWLARFFRGDGDDLEALPPPPEFREIQREHHGPPPPWFHPSRGNMHEGQPPSPRLLPPEFARHHHEESELPLEWQKPPHAPHGDGREHGRHGGLFDSLRPHREGPPGHRRGPCSDHEPKEEHHGSVLDWFRPHHKVDQHESKFDGQPLFDETQGKAGKRPHPKHSFDESFGHQDHGLPSAEHGAHQDDFNRPPYRHGRPDDRFEGSPSRHGKVDHQFGGPLGQDGRPDESSDGPLPGDGKSGQHFDGPPPEHGKLHGPSKGTPPAHHNPINCSDSLDAASSSSSSKDKEHLHRGPMSEALRAERLCRLARKEWNGEIDGFLRMEGGFEVILCDFEKHVDIMQIAQAKEDGERGRPDAPGARNDGEDLNSLKAVAARYDGIGGDRVKLDYDNFVSLFAHDDAVVIDDAGRPRVNNNTAVLEPVISAIKDLVVQKSGRGPKKNWQATADMVVSRYADRIEYLASGAVETLEAFEAETDRALRPFIDYGDRNATREIARCTAQFSSSAASDTLAAEAIRTVSSIICREFSRAGEVDELSLGVSMIRGLKSWLSWTAWKKCRGCAVNEVCVIPIWPMGTVKDFDEPQCRSGLSGGPRREGYWGRPGDRGGRGPRS